MYACRVWGGKVRLGLEVTYGSSLHRFSFWFGSHIARCQTTGCRNVCLQGCGGGKAKLGLEVTYGLGSHLFLFEFGI